MSRNIRNVWTKIKVYENGLDISGSVPKYKDRLYTTRYLLPQTNGPYSSGHSYVPIYKERLDQNIGIHFILIFGDRVVPTLQV